ncbi:hypothetical protein CRYUN_Cryun28dG0100600 [Craigia yunnanensis]
MAVGLDTGVPWVMCKEDNAPDPVINACNGFYCDAFSSNKPYKPTLWTEAWSGWFTEFVAQFTSAQFKTWHLQLLVSYKRVAHILIIICTMEEPTLDGPLADHLLQPVMTMMLQLMNMAHVFSSMQGSCAAFLSNYHTKSAARVMFNNSHYNLPPWSISILPDCRNVVFNTAIVGVKTLQIQMLPTNSKMFSWETYDEDISSLGESSRITAPGLLEQMNVTRDTSDYLWYTTSVDISPSESVLREGQKPTLNVDSAGHPLHVFINRQFSGSAFGTRENRRFHIYRTSEPTCWNKSHCTCQHSDWITD